MNEAIYHRNTPINRLKKWSQVERYSSKVFYFSDIYPLANEHRIWHNGLPDYNANSLYYAHNEAANLLFLDGHVEVVNKGKVPSYPGYNVFNVWPWNGPP
ncbi:MAG: hypothetical protein NC833_00575 [Candidatus Omnitrophica bacterium]|nr:hypothetical protein [Candidatus Omnitrophota bacterium]